MKNEYNFKSLAALQKQGDPIPARQLEERVGVKLDDSCRVISRELKHCWVYYPTMYTASVAKGIITLRVFKDWYNPCIREHRKYFRYSQSWGVAINGKLLDVFVPWDKPLEAMKLAERLAKVEVQKALEEL